jgi:hypothetical protein
MGAPKQFKCADWGDIDEIENAQGNPIFKEVAIHWSKPKIWHAGETAPIAEDEASNCLYCLVRDHHRASSKTRIVYVGITKDGKRRFVNHHVAKELTKKRGQTSLSIGTVDFGSYWRSQGTRLALEQLEHLLIWALWPELNDRKSYTLPGMGKNPTKPWHIRNLGYRFSGVMPRELVYPWMLVKPGRDRSAK